jgi:paraquat-inducible protein A
MPSVIVCPACDLAHRRSPAPIIGRLRCSRCRAPLLRAENAAVDTAIALALCALVLLFLTNVYPLVTMRINGSSRDTTLIGAALGLHAQGFDSLAALVFLTTVIGPLVQIVALLYVLIPLWRGRRAPGQGTVLRVFTHIRSWSFMEVFLLGALAALVRLAKFAHITPGISLWCCVLLMLCLSELISITSPGQLWQWVERSRE